MALVVAAIQLVGGTFANRATGDRSLDVLGYLLLLIGPCALVWRRAKPLPALVVALSACVAYLLVGYGYGPIFLALLIAFLTAGTTGSRWLTYPLVPLGYLVLVWPLPTLLGRPANLWQVFALLAWLAVLVSIAEGLRQRRAALDERRHRAEAARREEQNLRARRTTEERLAIARELHDVLAHSLSMINVQSSVALELFAKQPEQAESALAAIKTASRDALTEVHSLLHSIRTGGTAGVAAPAEPEDAESDPDSDLPAAEPDPTDPPPRQQGSSAPRAPVPSIEDLDALLQHSRAAGMRVETRIIGTPAPLPAVIDVASARIIQESLTNVARHAPGADAMVTVRYAKGSVDLTVDNTRATATPPRAMSGGNGIVGMRERAHALGGALTAGPRPSGGFRVAARLPAQLQEPSDDSAPAQDDLAETEEPRAPALDAADVEPRAQNPGQGREASSPEGAVSAGGTHGSRQADR
ncbi:histidine kinase [Nocardia callitridis]|uniref:histidine kinase n=1 Tax=Nocardia callitridis TaxID=648753 RepID=A0ABP9JZN5_9NOCA